MAKTAPQPDVPPVAGERTREVAIWFGPNGSASAQHVEGWEQVWMVELSRLRAAEEERDVALASVVSPEEMYDVLAERDRLSADIERLTEGFGYTADGSLLDMCRRICNERTELKLTGRKLKSERDRLAAALRTIADAAVIAHLRPSHHRYWIAQEFAREALASLEGGDDK